MPTIAVDQQKQFKLTVIDGLPQAAVEMMGKARWVKCCPLCGCTHQIFGVDESIPYTPLCQTLPVLYKTQQAIWHQLYPDVSQYMTLHLVWDTSKEIAHGKTS
jgi:hypothetical protein